MLTSVKHLGIFVILLIRICVIIKICRKAVDKTMKMITELDYINVMNVDKISKWHDIFEKRFRYSLLFKSGVRIEISQEIYEYLRDQVLDWDKKADLVNGKVPASQLPSYVDDVEEYASLSAFPNPGETGKIYVAIDTNNTYRWTGTGYVQVGGSELTEYIINASVNSTTNVLTLNNANGTTVTLKPYTVTLDV